ncbi:MAG: NAD+ synthase, partial [bacterium]|nr:NAD+ synthase [bacterium]
TLTGYSPRDLVEIRSFIDKSEKTLDLLAKKVPPALGVLLGLVTHNKTPGAKPLFNSAVLLHEGKIKFRYHKCLVPTYDVFDEGRHFQPGTPGELLIFKGKKIGVSICEDIWNDKLFWKNRFYPSDPIEEQVKNGAELLVNLSASPYALKKEQRRQEMLQAVAIKHGVPIAYVNLVGGNDELVFDGGSVLLDKKGNLIQSGPFFQEALVVGDPFSKGKEKRLLSEEIENVVQALLTGIRDYAQKCGFKKITLGLSGGVDSAVVAALAARALGPQNVLCVIMPSPYTSRESIEDAEALVKNLGALSQTISISKIFESYQKELTGPLRLKKNETNVSLENIQARIRGNILMALSNQEGYLVLATGNKSELAVGYCTLYGDMSGGLSVIADLPKTLVYKVADYLNKEKEIIPERILTKAPTAELRPNQTDQDSLPPYDLLDKILKLYIEESKGEEEIVAAGFDAAVVEDVLQRVKKNEYKRRQASPGIRVSEKAFGMGRRFPIARKI